MNPTRISLTLVLALPLNAAVVVSIAWGLALLGALTYFVARSRNAPLFKEIVKHVVVAIAVIVVSRMAAASINILVP